MILILLNHCLPVIKNETIFVNFFIAILLFSFFPLSVVIRFALKVYPRKDYIQSPFDKK